MDSELKIIKKNYENEYFNMLAIIDHINECQALYYKVKLKETNPNELEKELMDLFILLNLFKDNNQDLYKRRVLRFFEKIKCLY
jgi:hypothetical protein